MGPARPNGTRVLLPALTLGFAFATAEGAHAQQPPTPPVENSMREYRIGETEVATVGRFRVALAKTWEETRNEKKVLVAWLSVVEKGSGNGPRDLEMVVGEPLVLGDATFEIVEVTLALKDKSGTVQIREKKP